MTVDLRCPRCGSLVKVKARGWRKSRCPRCGAKLKVPRALAALPQPKLPAAAPASAPRPPPADDVLDARAKGPPAGAKGSAASADDPDALDQAGPAAAVAVAMPWVLSALLHVGLFLVMVFFVLITGRPEERPLVATVPGFWEATGPVMDTSGWDGRRDARDEKPRPVPRPRPERPTDIDRGGTAKPVELLSPGERNGDEAGQKTGLYGRVSGVGDGGRLFPVARARAHHIVYVVDRSGSMAPYFDEVRRELADSIGRLAPSQDFHVVLFGDNRTFEGPRRGLVPADEANRKAVAAFLRAQRTVGPTTALVALKRAFAVLSDADPSRPGTIVFLLTDGDFSGLTGGSTYRPAGGRLLSGNEAVVQWLRDNNRRGVQVNTLLIGPHNPTAEKVLGTIAEENGGRYKYVSADEYGSLRR